jgi:hypothetical protein
LNIIATTRILLHLKSELMLFIGLFLSRTAGPRHTMTIDLLVMIVTSNPHVDKKERERERPDLSLYKK